jgi:hypothetical protein
MRAAESEFSRPMVDALTWIESSSANDDSGEIALLLIFSA